MAHRLLLADDSITIQKVIELTFADEGIEVVAVGDGDQAIARLDAEHFDIVLADVGMPGKDGFEVAAHLLSRGAETRVPVILLTGAFEPVDADHAALVGARAVLAKPFEPQVLVAKVRELLDRPGLADGSGTGDDSPSAADSLLTQRAKVDSPSTEDYFQRLDRAFASLNVPLEPRDPNSPRPRRPAPAAVEPPASEPGPAPPVPTAPVLVTTETPALAVASPAPVAGPLATGLADAFGRLLAVEQGELPPSALDGPSPDDDLVDRVTRRVVEQLGDRAVRDLATDIVSRTAERLVREEIERIKGGSGRGK